MFDFLNWTPDIMLLGCWFSTLLPKNEEDNDNLLWWYDDGILGDNELSPCNSIAVVLYRHDSQGVLFFLRAPVGFCC